MQAIYADELRTYINNLGGECKTRRASHVEPSDKDDSCWMVDFAPLGGSKHYEDGQGRRFEERSAALAYEVELLRTRMLEGVLGSRAESF